MKHTYLVATTVLAAAMMASSAWAMGPGSGMANACQGVPQGNPGAGGNPPMAELMNMSATLNLTPEQQAAWTEFMETVQRKRGEMMGVMFSRGPSRVDSPAPAVLRDNARKMENRVHMMRSMADALEKLYSHLTPEQQAILSQTIANHEGG